MRKIYLTLGCTLLASATSLNCFAQLPNATFTDWVDCIPWTSADNTAAQGTTPKNWCISNVIGIPMGSFFGNMGATTVGEEYTTDTEGFSAVKVFNNKNSMMESQIVPGYFTLGTTWSTSNGMSALTGDTSTNDGGSFGGIEFTGRPDGLAFQFQRALGDAANSQWATVVAYTWTGTFTQKDVPGNIYLSEESMVKTDMVDRDRNILGIETNLGGEVTKTEGAELIAKINRPIDQVTDAWTEMVVPFEYVSDAAPEKLNIIFAANDYFSSENIEYNNSLCVMNPRVVYFSQLASLSIGGESVNNFQSGVYDYYVETLPALGDVTYEVLGQAATAEIKEEDGKILIVVTNAEGEDADGQSTHTYTIAEGSNTPAGDAVNYTGKLVISMMGGELTPEGGMDASISITPTANGTCTFVLPNFMLDLGSGAVNLGDIVVNDVTMTEADGLTTYAGTVKDLKLDMAGTPIVADVDLQGSTTTDGKADMTINVVWNNIPITCTFTGDKIAGIGSIVGNDDNAPVEIYDLRGVRMNGDNLPAGVYIRRQGKTTTKIVVR